jgi:hypothetical protein
LLCAAAGATEVGLAETMETLMANNAIMHNIFLSFSNSLFYFFVD